MATPAAVLSIIVEANTGKAEAALKEFQRDLSKVDREKAEATLAAEVDKGGFNVFSGLVSKADAQRADATLGVDVDTSDFARARAAQAVLTKESSKLSDVFDRSSLSIGHWAGILAASIPVVVDLGGALGALTGSLGAATAGLGALGVGAGGALTVGLAGIVSVAAPAIASLGDLKTAQDAYTEAVDRYGKGSSQAETALTKLAFEQKRAGPLATALAGNLATLTRRWRALTKAGQSDFIGLMNDGVTRLNRKLPLLAESANSSMKALRRGFDAFLDRATGPGFNHFIHVMTRTFAKSIGPISRAFGNIAIVLERLAVAVAPDIVRMVQGFEGMTQGWVDSTRNARKLRDTIRGLVGHTEAWWDLLVAAKDLIVAVLVPGMGQGRKAVKGMTDQLKEWTDWVNSHPKEIKDFFKEAMETTAQLAKTLLSFLPILFEIGQATRPLARAVLKIVEFLNSIKIGNISAMTALFGIWMSSKLVKGVNSAVGAFQRLRSAALGAAVAEKAALTPTPGGGLRMEGGKVTSGPAVAPVPTGMGKARAFLGDTAKMAKYAKVAGGVAVAVTAVAGAFMALRDNFLGVRDVFTGFFDKVLKPIGDAFTDLVNQLSGGHAAQIFGAIGDALETIAKPLKWVLTNMTKLVGLLAIGAIATPFVLALTAIAAPIWVAIKGITLLVKGLKRVGGAVKGAAGFIKDHWGKVGHILGAPFRAAWDLIKRVLGFIRDKVRDSVGFIRDRWGVVKGILAAPFRVLGGFVADKFRFVIEKVRSVIGFIKDRWGSITHVLTAPFRAVKSVVQSVMGFIKRLISAVKDAINKVGDLADKLPSIPSPGDVIDKARGGGVPFVPGVQKGGFVTKQGIVPLGFQHGGLVGKRGLKPGSRDTVPAMLEVGELVIPKEMVDKTKKNAKLTAAAMTGELGKGHKEASKDTEKFVTNHGKAWDRLRSTTSKTTERFRKGTVDDFQKTSKVGEQTTDKMRQRVSEGFSKMRGNAVETSGKMKQGVSEDFRELTGAVGDGLRKIGQMTNNALRALGVKKVNFSIGVKGKQRGGLIPGTGDGDKVPVMAEPGEGFINKKAVQALGGKAAIDKINKATPRFAKGGIVAAGKLAQTMGLTPSEHPAYGGVGGGHTGGSYHYKNQAIDVSGGDMRRYFGAVANRWMGHGLAELFYDPMGRYVKNDSWVQGAIGDHMDHVHVAITSAFGGAMVKKLKQVLLKGPDGPMTDMGQASLDKVRKAADSYIQKKMPTEGMEGAIMGSGDVERMFARVAKKLSTSKTATLALGEAGFAESGMRDLAYGHSTSQGALQLLSSTAAGMGLDPHDEGAIASAFLLRGFYGRGGANKLAAQGLPAHLVAQGVQGSAFASGSNYAAQAANAKSWMRRFGLREGGVVPGFQRGGVLRIPRFDKGGAVMQSGLREASKSPVDRAAHAVAHRVGKAVASVSDVVLKRGDREGDKAVNKKATQVAKPVLEDRKVLGVVDRTGVQHLARGGMVAAPFVGSFDKGGEVAKTGLGMLHKGEHVEPPEHGRGSPFRQYHVMIKRLAKHIERVQARLEEVREQKRPQWQRREMRLERRIEHTRGETGEQRQLVEELKELRKDIREHNHLYRTVRRSDKQALAAIVDLTSAQIGAQGQQKSRLAGWGVDRRY